MKKKLLLCSIIIVLTLVSGCKKEENNSKLKTNDMISYTIDGKSTSIKPKKEDGYIVNKIICNNGTDMMWDNDNWEVELIDIKKSDRCVVDFTKDENSQGYRVNVISDNLSSLDSKSKATTLNGTVKIYPKAGYIIKEYSGCSGIIKDNVLLVKNVTENITCNVVTIKNTLADVIKEAYPSRGERTSFNAIYTTTAMHETTDYDGKTTYYLTGNPNNWVSFAGKLWRIIRINGDGSVRLLYAGTGYEDGYIGESQAYNTVYNNPMYVGWRYGSSGSLDSNRTNENKSDAYITVENWYNDLSELDKSYISKDAIYCNDRSIIDGEYSIDKAIAYSGYTRFVTHKDKPTLKCNSGDQFRDGFGLMSADEVVLAGGLYADVTNNSYFYLNKDGGSSTGVHWWWTMSAFEWNHYYSWVFIVHGNSSPGGLWYSGVDYVGPVIRPVISLKKEVAVVSGDGSGYDPYNLSYKE